MARTMRMAASLMAALLLVGGLALAQRDYDDDHDRDGNPAQARQLGYQSGYRDGMARGREEGRENDPFDYRTPDWRQATRGYRDWMGPISVFQRGYQEGYRQGFEAGYQSVNRRHGDDDDGDGWYYGRRSGNPAYNIGYQDGSYMGGEDMRLGKQFNATPRWKFDDRDHGYRSRYGSRDEYKREYSEGYQAGYQANYRERY